MDTWNMCSCHFFQLEFLITWSDWRGEGGQSMLGMLTSLELYQDFHITWFSSVNSRMNSIRTLIGKRDSGMNLFSRPMTWLRNVRAVRAWASSQNISKSNLNVKPIQTTITRPGRAQILAAKWRSVNLTAWSTAPSPKKKSPRLAQAHIRLVFDGRETGRFC